jgi:hypothetical protein
MESTFYGRLIREVEEADSLRTPWSCQVGPGLFTSKHLSQNKYINFCLVKIQRDTVQMVLVLFPSTTSQHQAQ